MLPVVGIEQSRLLSGKENGKLPSTVLTVIPGVKGGAPITLIHPAARAWKAMAAAAGKAGHVLKSSFATNSYRPYEDQLRIFLERYQTTPIPTTDKKFWNGRTWYKKPGVAIAARPGFSNHGWAQAVDGGEERDGDGGAEPFDAGTMNWLLANADEYGWSWELQSEPWHLHYFAGDRIPAKVVAYETATGGGSGPPPPSPVLETPMTLVYVKGLEAYRLITPWSIEALSDLEGYALDVGNVGLSAIVMEAALWKRITADYTGPKP